jgi:hypothetical protein
MKAQLASLSIMLALLVMFVPFPESRPVIDSFPEERGAIARDESVTVTVNGVLQSAAAIQDQPDALPAESPWNPVSHEGAGQAVPSPRRVRVRETVTADTPAAARFSGAGAYQASHSYQSGASLKTSFSGRMVHENTLPSVLSLNVGLQHHGILSACMTRRMKLSSVGSQEPHSYFEELVSPTYDPRLSSGESAPSAHLLNDQSGHPVRQHTSPRVQPHSGKPQPCSRITRNPYEWIPN